MERLGKLWPWFSAMAHGNMTRSVLTPLGAGHGWIALSPFFLLVIASIVLAVRATPHLPIQRRDAALAVAAFVGWLLLGGVGPVLLNRQGDTIDGALVLLIAAVSALGFAVARHGLWALATGLPLLVVIFPSLTDRPSAVATASVATLVLVCLFELIARRRPPRIERAGPAAPLV